MMHDVLMIPCETLIKYTDTDEQYCRPSMRGGSAATVVLSFD